MITEKDKIKHLYNRASFGMTLHDSISTADLNSTIKKVLKNPVPCHSLQSISLQEVKEAQQKLKQLPKEEKVDLKKLLRSNVSELNSLWLNEMINTEANLNEKMALFWHGHFACRTINPYFDQQYLDVIRRNALGNFAILLNEISKTPAMLQYLNNQQNKKDHPNENFAREVMELFTLGRGNYTENDVKEAARAFTGLGFDNTGEFKFKIHQHDNGTKTILGKTGNFTGEDVLQILLSKKECAYFITKKIYRYFVNEVMDEERVKTLADSFYQSQYDIKSLMHTIFTSSWFYDEKNIGTKIKSPIELMVGMFRIIPTTFTDNQSAIFIQRALGQLLLNPPNVAGWKGGKSWIDSSSLLFRMQLPQIIYYDKDIHFEPKEMTPESKQEFKMTEMMVKKWASKKLNAQSNWSTIYDFFSHSNQLEVDISNILMATKINASTIKLLKSYSDYTHHETAVKSIFVNVLSLPEYQLC